jgi:hypothetical protein
MFIGVWLALPGEGALAEKPRTPTAANEWQKGKKLAPAADQVYRLCAGTTITVASGSQLEVQNKIPLPTSIDGLGPYAYTAKLQQGRLDIIVDTKRKPANGVLIYGPRRTTVLASGGRIAVAATDQGMAVGVYEGKEAAVGIGSTWKHIPAGNLIVVSPEQPAGVESKLPTTPTGVVVARPVIAVEGQTDPSRALWQKVSEATKYRVMLRDGAGQVVQRLVTTEPYSNLTGLQPGRYELRVAALAPFDLDGAFSEPAYVNVVGVEMPPGGFVSGGRAFLEPGQQLKFSYVDGLEMTYDRASVYFKAATKTGLRNGQSTTVHLRVPGSTERASLEVVPRALDAKVELTPTLARWPRDKVRIHIRLPKGIANTTGVELIPQVTVNSRTIELDWVRTEGAIETVILGPPVYPGPWVVRAQVTDQHGYVLGRNFLEIASMAGQDEEELPVEVHRSATVVQSH